MNKAKPKMIASALIFVIAMVMLVSASMAWYTLSTKPEVTGISGVVSAKRKLLISKDNITWDRDAPVLNLSESFENLAPLKPVSTVDGLNWFLPEYEASGALKPVNQFTRDYNLTHANVSIAGLSGNALESAKRKGYYVYTDFYLKTEDDNANVQISYVNPYALENNDYGSDDCSYCLPSYTFELIDNETTIIDNNSVITAGGKKYQIRNVGLNAEKSVRIGFLVNPDYQDSPANSDYEAKNDFYIYEPNADLRSKDIKPGSKDYEERYKIKYSETERYIANYDFEEDTSAESPAPVDYKDDCYYETLPVAYNGGTYSLARITPSKLLAQKHCEWDFDALKQSYIEFIEGREPKWWSSKNVKFYSDNNTSIGSFLNSEALYNALQLSAKGGTGEGISLEKTDGGYPFERGEQYASQTIITLYKDKPVKIRMFVWIEGQDIDCWNDVSLGKFVVNVEFGDYTVE